MELIQLTIIVLKDIKVTVQEHSNQCEVSEKYARIY